MQKKGEEGICTLYEEKLCCCDLFYAEFFCSSRFPFHEVLHDNEELVSIKCALAKFANFGSRMPIILEKPGKNLFFMCRTHFQPK